MTSISWRSKTYSFIEENFLTIQNDIINHRLKTDIPLQMLDHRDPNKAKKRKRMNDDVDTVAPGNQPRKEFKGKAKATGDQQFDRLENPRPNPKWTIPKSIRFTDCFYKNDKLIDLPQYNYTPFCLQYFCLNLCKRGKFCNLDA